MPTGNNTYLTELDVRIWLRDTDPAANTLLDDLEFTPEEIRTASTLAVDYWNETPPQLSNYTVYTFPHRYHLLLGTVGNLFFIAANRYRRNQLDFTVPGGGISDQNKAPAYDEAGTRFWQQFKDWCAWQKKAENVHQGWGLI
jgi:hypothetical protein